MIESVKFKYGNLKLSEKIDGEYFWSGFSVKSTNAKMEFKEQIPISAFTKKKLIRSSSIQFIEKILDNVDFFLERAVSFLKETQGKNLTEYNIRDSELSELNLDIQSFPVDLPEINFYENNEWMIRFTTGRFYICDPYGIAIHFKQEEPVSVEDLSESEMID